MPTEVFAVVKGEWKMREWLGVMGRNSIEDLVHYARFYGDGYPYINEESGQPILN
jgi:hypothetical protein